MPNAKQRVIYVPWTPGLQPAWTVAGVRGALNTHERGQFNSSAMLIQAMGRDERLSAVVQTRLGGLFSRDFTVEPAGGEESDARAKTIAEELETDWFDMFPEADLMELWQWYLFAGVAIGELRWQRTADRWTPRLKVWDLQFAYADEDFQHYVLQTQQGEVHIPFGGGDGKWVVIGRGTRPWMNGLVRALATPWLVGQFALRDWARYSERHGMPLIKAMVPAVAEEPDREDFLDDIRALSTETTVTLPTALDAEGKVGFDLELLEATDRSWEGFQGLIRHIQDSYAIALTGNNLTTMVEGGSYAAAKEAGALRNEYAESDGQELSTQLREQAVEPWATVNFGDAEGRTPWPKWNTSPPEDLKSEAESINTLSLALDKLTTSGVPVDVPAMAERWNIPLLDIDVETGQELFAYHLEYGLLSENEARGRLGLEPVPDGDRRPLRADQIDPATGEAKEPQPVPATLAPFQPGKRPPPNDKDDSMAANIKLASGDDPNTAPGFIAGQMFADDVAEDGTRRSRRMVGIDLRSVLRVIETSTDYSDLRARLRATFADMDPEPFSALMEKAMVLGELAGRHAVLEDL
jgi:phage gp29-like protein